MPLRVVEASTRVVPIPHIGSKTRSPGRVAILMVTPWWTPGCWRPSIAMAAGGRTAARHAPHTAPCTPRPAHRALHTAPCTPRWPAPYPSIPRPFTQAGPNVRELPAGTSPAARGVDRGDGYGHRGGCRGHHGRVAPRAALWWHRRGSREGSDDYAIAAICSYQAEHVEAGRRHADQAHRLGDGDARGLLSLPPRAAARIRTCRGCYWTWRSSAWSWPSKYR